jgi:hypothetical protein
VTGYEKKPRKKKEQGKTTQVPGADKHNQDKMKRSAKKSEKDYSNSAVKKFFVDNGLEVCDNRENGGRLWVIGEKTDIRTVVNSAIAKFGISGKYTSGKEIKNKNGWFTKTDR